MKDSNLSFADGLLGTQAAIARVKGNPMRQFDFKKAAEIIKDRLKSNPTLVAEAGLEGDWNYTGGVIFADGKPTNDSYTYLCSNWAQPTLIIDDSESIACFIEGENSDVKWDDESLAILGINL